MILINITKLTVFTISEKIWQHEAPAMGERFYVISICWEICINSGKCWLFLKGLILCLRPANEKQGYFVTTSAIGWAQA